MQVLSNLVVPRPCSKIERRKQLIAQILKEDGDKDINIDDILKEM
jgi:hypothetical protein